MSNTIAVGSGPIAFTTKAGQALLIPLTAISFENGNVKLSTIYSSTDRAELQPWLDYLAKQGTIAAGEIAPSQTAFVIQATDSGIAGNNIQIELKNVTLDPADPSNLAKATFDAIVTEKETYTLSFDLAAPNFIKTILGTDKSPGTNLVHIKDADTPSKPKPGVYPLGNGNAMTKATKPVDADPAGSGSAFNLEAKKNGGDGNNTVATISSVDAAAKIFAMSVIWTQTIAAIKLADLPVKLEGTEKYIITVTKPDGTSSSFPAIPSAGVFVLNGGADKQDAKQASVAIPVS